jgi:hypothetical protein
MQNWTILSNLWATKEVRVLILGLPVPASDDVVKDLWAAKEVRVLIIGLPVPASDDVVKTQGGSDKIFPSPFT